jgi:Ca2+-binding EF-hand superfamily protein
MHSFNKVIVAAAMAAAIAGAPAAFAAKEDESADKFVKMCDTDKDGMVSKAEVMKAVEKMFDKHDTKKMGMLDKKQAEKFLAELMKGGG